MPDAKKILPHYTYADYQQWEGRWEIIDGIPYAMSPAPSPRHQWITANIMTAFKNALSKSGCKKCKVYNFIDYCVSDDVVLQPDVLIVCGEINKKALDFPPALVIEVLSASTAMKDRNNKLIIYRSQKIPFYLIVDPERDTVEIYRFQHDGNYEIMETGVYNPFFFKLDQDCTVSVNTSDFFE